MKQTMSRVLSLLLILAMLTGCSTNGAPADQAAGGGASESSTSPIVETVPEPPTFSGVIGSLEEAPTSYLEEAEEQGEVVRLDYKTTDYQDPSRTLEKYAYVYLPYGFSATDPETRYDVLYLLHGGGGNAERYFGGAGQSSEFKRILDHMIQNGDLRPMLVVTPTFYPTGSTDSSVGTAAEAAAHFPDELVNDLIPAVESTYPTYAETTDQSGLEASRDHRGIGGFSMGAVATWYAFADALDYFRYFLPMSGDSWIVGQRAGVSDPERTAQALSQALSDSGRGPHDFYIHTLTGTDDIAYDALSAQIAAMQDMDGFVYDPDTAVGNLYFSVQEGGTHDYSCIRQYLYNAMPVFWGVEQTDAEIPDIDASGEYEVEAEEVFAENQGDQIYGLLYRPVGAEGSRPTVIYSHGFGSSYRNGTQYAQALAAQGYLVYCFDFRGGSESSRSEGSNLEMSVFTEQSDLEAVISMLQSRDDVDRDNLFLLGASQGGMVSAMTAADNQDAIAGVVLLYPAFVLVDNAMEQFGSIDEVPESMHYLFMTVGRIYFEDLFGYDVYADIQGYNKDVLIVHGDRDSLVPLSYSERAVEVLPSAQLAVIPGAGHGFSGASFDLAMGYILDYLNARLSCNRTRQQ